MHQMNQSFDSLKAFGINTTEYKNAASSKSKAGKCFQQKLCFLGCVWWIGILLYLAIVLSSQGQCTTKRMHNKTKTTQ